MIYNNGRHFPFKKSLAEENKPQSKKKNYLNYCFVNCCGSTEKKAGMKKSPQIWSVDRRMAQRCKK